MVDGQNPAPPKALLFFTPSHSHFDIVAARRAKNGKGGQRGVQAEKNFCRTVSNCSPTVGQINMGSVNIIFHAFGCA